MKKLLLSGYAALLGLLAYQWVEAESTLLRLKQSSDALQAAHRETEETSAQLSASKQQLETAQSALQEAQAQLAQARTAASSASPAGASPAPAVTKATAGGTSFTENLLTLAEKASKLDHAFNTFPALEIPELALLTEADWIKAVLDHPKLETPDEIRPALESLISRAKQRALDTFRDAVRRTGLESNSKPIANLYPLFSELRQKMSEEILQRYEVLPASNVDAGWLGQPDVKKQLAEVDQPPSLVIREKNPVGGWQQVLIFFAMPQNRENGKSYRSSTSFGVSQKSQPR